MGFDNITKGIKNIYYSMEDQWYKILDKINKKIPVYKIIDPIDNVFPSFILFIILISFIVLIGFYFIQFGGPGIIEVSVYDASTITLLSGVEISGTVNSINFDNTTNSDGKVFVDIPTNKNIYNIFLSALFGEIDLVSGSISAKKVGYKELDSAKISNVKKIDVFLEKLGVASASPNNQSNLKNSTKVRLIDSKTLQPIIDQENRAYVSYTCSNRTIPSRAVKDNYDNQLDGTFTLYEPQCNFEFLEAWAPGYNKISSRKDLPSTKNIHDITLTQKVARQNGSAKIWIKDKDQNTSINGARVIFNGINDYSTSNETTGGVVNLELPPGTYTLTVLKEGYYSIKPEDQISITITSGQELRKSIYLERIPIENQRKINFILKDSEDVVEDARVRLIWLENQSAIDSKGVVNYIPGSPTHTDSNGEFKRSDFSIRDEGKIIAIIEKNDYQKLIFIPTLMKLDSNPESINFIPKSAENSGNVEVEVFYGENNQKIPGARVNLFADHILNGTTIRGIPIHDGYTNSEGKIEFDDVPAGIGWTYFAKAFVQEINSNPSDKKDLDAGQTINLQVYLDFNVSQIKFIIKDEKTDLEITNALVKLFRVNDLEFQNLDLLEEINHSNNYISKVYDKRESFAILITAPNYSSEKMTIDQGVLNEGINEFLIKMVLKDPPVSTICSTNADCPTGSACNEEGKCIALDLCENDTDCEGENVCKNNICTTPCEDEEDCEEGDVCQDGGCLTLCSINSDCDEDELCYEGICTPIKVCLGDEDCAEGQLCQNNSCVVNEVACLLNGDCPGKNNFCINNVCKITLPCDKNEDCESNICIDGGCVSLDDFCEIDEDCPENSFCKNNSCVVIADCSKGCGDGEVCYNGICTISCENDNDCEGEEICNDDNVCVIECENHEDCGNGVCDNGICKSLIECSITKPCPKPNQTCKNGFCTVPSVNQKTCTTENDCGDFEFCDNQEGVCRDLLIRNITTSFRGIFNLADRVENNFNDSTARRIEKNNEYYALFSNQLDNEEINYHTLLSLIRVKNAEINEAVLNPITNKSDLAIFNCTTQDLDNDILHNRDYYFPNCGDGKKQAGFEYITTNIFPLDGRNQYFVKFKATGNNNEDIVFNYRSKEMNPMTADYETKLKEERITIGKSFAGDFIIDVEALDYDTAYSFFDDREFKETKTIEMAKNSKTPLRIRLTNNYSTSLNVSLNLRTYDDNPDEFLDNSPNSTALGIDGKQSSITIPSKNSVEFDLNLVSYDIFSSNYFVLIASYDSKEIRAFIPVDIVKNRMRLGSEAKFIAYLSEQTMQIKAYDLDTANLVNIREYEIKTFKGCNENDLIEERSETVNSTDISVKLDKGPYDTTDCIKIKLFAQDYLHLQETLFATGSYSPDPELACVQVINFIGKKESSLKWEEIEKIKVINNCGEEISFKIDTQLKCIVNNASCNRQIINLGNNNEKEIEIHGKNIDYKEGIFPNFTDLLGNYNVNILARKASSQRFVKSDEMTIHLTNPKQCFSIDKDELNFTESNNQTITISNDCYNTALSDPRYPQVILDAIGYQINEAEIDWISFDINMDVSGKTYETIYTDTNYIHELGESIRDINFLINGPSQTSESGEEITTTEEILYNEDYNYYYRVLPEIKFHQDSEKLERHFGDTFWEIQKIVIGVIDRNYVDSNNFGAKITNDIKISYLDKPNETSKVKQNFELYPELRCGEPNTEYPAENCSCKTVGQNIECETIINIPNGKVSLIETDFISSLNVNNLEIYTRPTIKYTLRKAEIVESTSNDEETSTIALGGYGIPSNSKYSYIIGDLRTLEQLSNENFVNKFNTNIEFITNNPLIEIWVKNNYLMARYKGTQDSGEEITKEINKEFAQGTTYNIINIQDIVRTFSGGKEISGLLE